MQKIWILISLLILCADPASAAIYRCSSNGKTIYSDRPCSNNREKMSVVDTSPAPSPSRDQSAPSPAKNSAQLTHLRFRYEIADNEVRQKEKDIDETIALTSELEKAHQEKIAALNSELKRIYRNSSYGKYRAHQVKQKIQTENIRFANRMAIARNRLNSLYEDLGRLKDDRYRLQQAIRQTE